MNSERQQHDGSNRNRTLPNIDPGRERRCFLGTSHELSQIPTRPPRLVAIFSQPIRSLSNHRNHRRMFLHLSDGEGVGVYSSLPATFVSPKVGRRENKCYQHSEARCGLQSSFLWGLPPVLPKPLT